MGQYSLFDLNNPSQNKSPNSDKSTGKVPFYYFSICHEVLMNFMFQESTAEIALVKMLNMYKMELF